MLARRAEWDPALGSVLSQHALDAVPLLPHAVVGGFWPMRGEINIRPLLYALAERGHVVALPETLPGQPLAFRRWHPGMAMVDEPFGTQRPVGVVVTPRVLFVPLLAFDRRGGRLGYGGGYYDRTIEALPGVAVVGCAYAAQEVESVPAGPHDKLMQAVATERGVIRCEA